MKASKEDNILKLTPIILPFVIMLWGILYILFMEKIPIFAGFGWDGQIYGGIAADIRNIKQLNPYHIQRILPSTIIYICLNIFQIQKTPSNIIAAFQIYNLILIIFSCFIWLRLSKLLKLSSAISIIGFNMLFINYPILKFSLYYSVLVDTTVFCIGLVAVYGFIINNTMLLYLCLIISYFTSPASLPISLGFILFPFTKSNVYDSSIPSLDYINRIIFYVLTVLLFIFMTYIVFVVKDTFDQSIIWYINKWISIFFLFLFVVAAYYPFVEGYNWHLCANFFFNKIFMMHLLIIGFTFYCLAHLKSQLLSIEQPTHLTFLKYVADFLLMHAVQNPLRFIISHTIFFGPSILLIIIFWKDIVIRIKSAGFGAMLVSFFLIFLSLDSESRHLIGLYPFIIVFLMLAMQETVFQISTRFIIFFSMLSITFSKIWLPIRMPIYWIDGTSPLDPRYQRFFMQFGPWIDFKLYVFHSIVIIIIFVFFLFLFTSHRQRFSISVEFLKTKLLNGDK
jgi:hypothetical protein